MGKLNKLMDCKVKREYEFLCGGSYLRVICPITDKEVILCIYDDNDKEDIFNVIKEGIPL